MEFVEAQKEAPAKTPATPKPSKPAAVVQPPAASVPAAVPPAADAAPVAAATTPEVVAADATVATAAQSSGPAGVLLPLLIGLAIIAGLGGPVTRLVHAWRSR